MPLEVGARRVMRSLVPWTPRSHSRHQPQRPRSECTRGKCAGSWQHRSHRSRSRAQLPLARMMRFLRPPLDRGSEWAAMARTASSPVHRHAGTVRAPELPGPSSTSTRLARPPQQETTSRQQVTTSATPVPSSMRKLILAHISCGITLAPVLPPSRSAWARRWSSRAGRAFFAGEAVADNGIPVGGNLIRRVEPQLDKLCGKQYRS